jgi:NADPH-dependent glutamate synthase beta subunit-like oxidoreductase
MYGLQESRFVTAHVLWGIPDFNDMVHQEEWENALAILQSTNNFPEFTGRLCPAPAKIMCWNHKEP